ncbi:phytoene synthase [Gordoniibacillus kamchatkensis]|uniref:Phytoene synthase n=1 Tax=Gordoniibacillus kamchatkensis TaxID=1590651 RepID=A0ABR5AFP8_9BACL|nr:phytoene/squalene synthase family protein [Paenibacillus sp. VKM B-2647]KIL39844.1 phytoene synthase [Paenibacillus sp. VKM B-2647]
MTMLEQTSRTFYIPISRLVSGLKEAVTSAYLCMRAIDEIEDHPELADEAKTELLQRLGEAVRSSDTIRQIREVLSPYETLLPPVTMRLHEWVLLCPESAAGTVRRYIAMMAEQMAEWVGTGWSIRTEADLDRYTYSVAGMVGEMLSELWLWHDDTKSDMAKAVAFGRGLQAVNIIRNRAEDLERGVDFFPDGWGLEAMLEYTNRNLRLADAYVAELGQGPALEFCSIPLALAHATIRVIASGGSKLTRTGVLDIVSRVTG